MSKRKSVPPPNEVFAMLVTRAFQQQFGVAASRLQLLSEWMLQPNTNLFAFAHDRAEAGMVVLLLTNLKDVFIRGTDVDLEEYLHYGYLRHDGEEAYFLLKLNPVVNELLRMTTTPAALPVTDRKYALIRKAERLQRTQTLEEMQILALVRAEGSHKVTILFENDRPTRAIVNRRHPADTDVNALASSDPFQQIKIEISDEETRFIEQAISKRFEANLDADGRRIPMVIQVLDDERE